MDSGGQGWVCMGVNGCVWINCCGGTRKTVKTGTHLWPNAHDFPAMKTGKFPQIYVWVRGGAEGHAGSCMVVYGFA